MEQPWEILVDCVTCSNIGWVSKAKDQSWSCVFTSQCNLQAEPIRIVLISGSVNSWCIERKPPVCFLVQLFFGVLYSVSLVQGTENSRKKPGRNILERSIPPWYSRCYWCGRTTRSSGSFASSRGMCWSSHPEGQVPTGVHPNASFERWFKTSCSANEGKRFFA